MTDIELADVPTHELIEHLEGRMTAVLGGKSTYRYQTNSTFSVCVTVSYRANGNEEFEHYWSLEEAEEAAENWRQDQRETTNHTGEPT